MRYLHYASSGTLFQSDLRTILWRFCYLHSHRFHLIYHQLIPWLDYQRRFILRFEPEPARTPLDPDIRFRQYRPC